MFADYEEEPKTVSLEHSGKTINYFLTHKIILKADSPGKIYAERFAHGFAMTIKKAGQAHLHTVVCAIIYNDKVYFGRSGHGMSKYQLHKNLKNVVLKGTFQAWDSANCAEVEAVNKMCEDGFDPNTMGSGIDEVYACYTSNGDPREICTNCLFLVGLAKEKNVVR